MADSLNPPLLAVAGATASGKSSFSVMLAKELASDIISVDSVQMFRGCDVGSAKISVAEQQGVIHHLLDVLDPNQIVNAGIFCSLANQKIVSLREQKRQALLCVGTTMYFSALLHGLVAQPAADDDVRARVQALSAEQAYAVLCEVDPQRAKVLHPRDRSRVSRALEVFWSTGQQLGPLIVESSQRRVEYQSLTIMLCWPRDELYRRINERTAKMLSDGLLDEVDQLRSKFGENCVVFSTLGYKQALAVLRGEMKRTELAENIATATRQFAKRQLTFWRNEPNKRLWASRPQQTISAVAGKPGKGKVATKRFETLPFSREQLLQELRQRLMQPFQTSEIWYVEADSIL